ncbi:MAG: WG repeat-containing protein [Prevotellaceae bacterium]|jgi:hypothetical protein|nr:WG repeat-containing protein [Prevotellaceae bacterium]
MKAGKTILIIAILSVVNTTAEARDVTKIYDVKWIFSGIRKNTTKKDKHEFAGKPTELENQGKKRNPSKRYKKADKFSEGLAAVKLNGKYGFIDRTGMEIIPFRYDDAGAFSEGLAKVRTNGKWGFIDKMGKEAIPSIYDNVGSFSEGLVAAQSEGKYGFIDKTGKEVISFKYDDAGIFSDGLARVRSDGKWLYIDASDKIVIGER